MPIRVTNKRFTSLGNLTTFLKANVGDPIQSTLTIQESIAVNSADNNTLQNSVASDIINWVGGDFEEEGFRAGQSITITTYTISTGVVLATTTTTIEWVIGGEMKVATTLSSWYSFPDEAVSIFASASRQGLKVDINNVSNGTPGNQYSLLDGEASTFSFDLTGIFPTQGVAVGNQSGMYSVSTSIDLVSSTPGLRNYTLTTNFIQSGLYNSNLYDFDNCLKLYQRMSWETLIGEPYDNTIEVFNDDANTGWFNQAYNTEVINSTLVQSIQEVSYCDDTIATFVVDSAIVPSAFGGAYVSNNTNYYKNKSDSASKYSIMLGSVAMNIGQSYASQPNEDGSQWLFETLSIISVGTQHTINIKINPNNAFQSFMASQPEGNRTFYLWCKVGNVNLLVFNGQLNCPPVGTLPLTMIKSEYFDHSQQLTNTDVLETGVTANVEDDLAFCGKFRFPIKRINEYLNAKIQAYNLTTAESFTLQQTSFNLSGIPLVNFQQPIDLQAPVLTSLPTTSVKRIATLSNDTSIDFGTSYGVKLYFPFIYRWEYWIAQLNANADFFPNNQTRDWVDYGTTGDWRLRLVVDNARGDNLYQYTDLINILDYDSDANILQVIELYIDSSSTNVQVVTEGELMRVVATHTLVDGSAWSQDSVWGMITIEPTESSQRWLSSTAIDYDNNLSNPLYPLTGLRCDLTFPTTDVARLECFFDPDKINLSNGVKFTSKIKGCTDGDVIKLTTSGLQKLTNDGNQKIKS